MVEHATMPRVVGARVDALCIAYSMSVDRRWLQELDRAKAGAREGGSVVSIAGESFAVERQGKRGKLYALQNASGWIFVGETSVIVKSAVPLLAARCLPEVVDRAEQITRAFAQSGDTIDRRAVNELDLCVDLAGATFSEADRAAFVGRLTATHSWESDMKRNRNRPELTGLRIGSVKALSFVLYDKTVELAKRHGVTSERDAAERAGWSANGWDGAGHVWRAELRARGGALTDYGLREPAMLADKIDSVWQDFTRRSLRLVDLGSATRRDRCAVDPRWKALQLATFTRADAAPVERMRVRGSGASMALATGTMASALAARGTTREKAEETLGALLSAVDDDVEKAKLGARLDRAYARQGGLE